MKRSIQRNLFITFILLTTLVFSYGCSTATPPAEEAAERFPNIGISWCEDTSSGEYSEDLQVYLNAVEQAGGTPVLLPLLENEAQAKEAIAGIDGLVMTGGEDVDPSYYGEEPAALLETVNEARDVSDQLLIASALDADIPMLAICRGCQFLNVALGGSLYQDIPTQYTSPLPHRSADQVDFVYHEITVAEDSVLFDIMQTSTLTANSWHHQGVKELGEGLTVIATAEDGMVEAIQKKDATFVLGLQFHPEWHIDYGDAEYLPIFQRLVIEANAYNLAQ